jgi:hypothetical protein
MPYGYLRYPMLLYARIMMVYVVLCPSTFIWPALLLSCAHTTPLYAVLRLDYAFTM